VEILGLMALSLRFGLVWLRGFGTLGREIIGENYESIIYAYA
jgi:hypothetical protein